MLPAIIDIPEQLSASFGPPRRIEGRFFHGELSRGLPISLSQGPRIALGEARIESGWTTGPWSLRASREVRSSVAGWRSGAIRVERFLEPVAHRLILDVAYRQWKAETRLQSEGADLQGGIGVTWTPASILEVEIDGQTGRSGGHFTVSNAQDRLNLPARRKMDGYALRTAFAWPEHRLGFETMGRKVWFRPVDEPNVAGFSDSGRFQMISFTLLSPQARVSFEHSVLNLSTRGWVPREPAPFHSQSADVRTALLAGKFELGLAGSLHAQVFQIAWNQPRQSLGEPFLHVNHLGTRFMGLEDALVQSRTRLESQGRLDRFRLGWASSDRSRFLTPKLGISWQRLRGHAESRLTRIDFLVPQTTVTSWNVPPGWLLLLEGGWKAQWRREAVSISGWADAVVPLALDLRVRTSGSRSVPDSPSDPAGSAEGGWIAGLSLSIDLGGTQTRR